MADFAPVSLEKMLRLKHIYYERTLDSKPALRDAELRASKLKRPNNSLHSSEATAYYHVPSKSACSNCLNANSLCDGIKPYCGRCVRTSKQTSCYIKSKKRVKKLESNLSISVPVNDVVSVAVVDAGTAGVVLSTKVEDTVMTEETSEQVLEMTEINIDLEMEGVIASLEEEERSRANSEENFIPNQNHSPTNDATSTESILLT